MVGGDVVGHVVQDQAHSPAGELHPRRRKRRGAPEAPLEPVAADAVGRADHIAGREVGQRGPKARFQLWIALRDGQPGRAALPDAHQPDRIDIQGGEPVPFVRRDRPQGHPPPQRPAQIAEPDRGVDLVDRRARGQAHRLRRRGQGMEHATGSGAGLERTSARRRRSNRSGGWPRDRRRCRRGSTRGTGAARASADRTGTARSRRRPAGARRRRGVKIDDQAARDLVGDLARFISMPEPVGHSHLEVVAVVTVELAQTAQDHQVHREPDRPAPVRVPAEHAGVRLGRLIVDAELLAGDVERRRGDRRGSARSRGFRADRGTPTRRA